MIDSAIFLIATSLLTLVPGFEDIFSETTEQIGLNFLIVEHEDLSVTLYAWNNATTNVGLDGFPDRMTPLASYANSLALYGKNGIADVLGKLPTWNLTNNIIMK